MSWVQSTGAGRGGNESPDVQPHKSSSIGEHFWALQN
jgi:hypothetical protein